jgi:hypothetical protein
VYAIQILNITIPDSRPLFIGTVAVHVAAGITCVGAGALAATARKQPGRHPHAGTVYLYGLAVIWVTATILAVMRWRHDWHLFILGTLAASLGLFGFVMRRRGRPGWKTWHGSAMGGSYVVLLTAFYVDNGPQIPLWKLLPHVTYWVLPSAVGIPIIVAALIHNGALRAPRMMPRSRDDATR